MRTRGGFTIVELLIVIVVIAILAVITVVSYNGISQRAHNTRTITAVRQIMTLTEAYRATYSTEPYAPATVIGLCATLDSRCTTNAGAVNTRDNSPLMSELSKVGTPPKDSGEATPTGLYGIQYIYLTNTAGTFNGAPSLVRLEYWLRGSGVSCGVQNVASAASNVNPVVTSTTGYTSTANGITSCSVRL